MGPWLRRIAIATLIVIAVLATISAIRVQSFPVRSLTTQVPRETALMRQRVGEARVRGHTLRIRQHWVGYSGVSPLLRRAILIAEDDAFFSHDGLDWNEIQAS